MANPDLNITRQTLDSLRVIRRKLYAIPEAELSAMSLDDQVIYGETLHQTALAILKLEAARLQGVNDAFKAKEKELQSSADKLEADTSALTETVKIIRVASEGIRLVTTIIQLLA